MIDFYKRGSEDALKKLGFNAKAPWQKPIPPPMGKQHPLQKQLQQLRTGMPHRYALGKQADTRVPVIHEEDEDNQTHQRQAQKNENMALTGPGVSGVWDRFDDLIQNPAVASDHVRFVGE